MSASKIELFYFPFYLETFTPITTDDIEARARCSLSLPADGREVHDLREVLAGSEPGAFDARVVRLKIVGLDGGDVFVDQEGGLLFGAGQKEAQLGRATFDQLEQLIERVGKAQRCVVR